VSDAQDFLNKYNAGLKSITRWKKFINRRAITNDMFTFFGRPRRMSRYFKSGTDNRQRAFGYRTSVNTIVQGTAGDILRLAFCRILQWQQNNPELVDKFMVLNTVHDEINFSVRNDWLAEFYELMVSLMTMNFKEWDVPLEVDVSIGENWGECVPYRYKNGTFVPDGKVIYKK
jgi:DNA polymerase I-like protein with 3'-5' exonuclease and polymerase domains